MHNIPASIPWPVQLTISVFFAILGGVIFFGVSPDMDIFLPFHPLACAQHPYSYLNSYQEPCDGKLDLLVGGVLHWSRASSYQGLAYSILYYPLFKLWPAWQSGVLFATIWMALSVYAFARLTSVNLWLVAFIFGGNFFWMYNNLEDVSPVSFQNALIFLIPLCVRMILQVRGFWSFVGANIVLAVAIFGGFEYKVIFGYYFVAAVILSIVFNLDVHPFWRLLKMAILKCSPAILLAGAAIALLLFAQTPDGRFYYTEAFTRRETYNVLGFLKHFKNMAATYLFNFPNSNVIFFAQMAQLDFVDAAQNYKDVLITSPFWLFFVGVHVWFIRASRLQNNITEAEKLQSRHYRTYALWLWICGIAVMALISSNTWTRHAFHLIPGFSCLLGAMALCVDFLYQRGKINLRPFIWGLGLSQIACALYVVSSEPKDEFSWDRFTALEQTYKPEIADHGFIVHVDWGTYYISALYGAKNQVAAYIPLYTDFWQKPEKIEALRSKAHSNGRHIVFVRQRSSGYPGWDKIKAAFPNLIKLYPADGTPSKWEIWAESSINARMSPASWQTETPQ